MSNTFRAEMKREKRVREYGWWGPMETSDGWKGQCVCWGGGGGKGWSQ